MKFIHENSPETDIIFITAAAEIEIVKKAFRHGVDRLYFKTAHIRSFQGKPPFLQRQKGNTIREGAMQEDSIKFLWNKTHIRSTNFGFVPPKGIDPMTKEKVVNHIKSIEGGITAETLGLEIGVSRSTARRYLRISRL